MSDVLRLKKELETIFVALLDEIEDAEPELSRRDRREQARNRLLAIVDEAIQDVTRPQSVRTTQVGSQRRLPLWITGLA